MRILPGDDTTYGFEIEINIASGPHSESFS